MPGAAFSVAGGAQSVRTATSYLLNETGAQPIELPGMAKELFVRNPSAAPLVRVFESIPKVEDGWDDYWRWVEDARLTETGALAGSLGVAGALLTVDDGNIFTPRDIVMVDRTYYCQIVSISGDDLTVTWIGDAPVAVLPVDTAVIKIGTAYRQIDSPNASPLTRTAEFWNGWQHMLTEFKCSIEYANGNFRFGPEEQRQLRKKDDEFDELRAKTYIWGQRSMTYLTANNTHGTLRGVWNWAGHVEDIGGAELVLGDLQDFVQGWCTGNVMEGEKRICDCPLNVMRQIDDLFMDRTLIVAPAGDVVPKEWGLHFKAYTIAGKTINFVHDPILDLHGWHDVMIGYNLAPGVLTRRNKRGIGAKHYKAHVQPYGEDEFVQSGHFASHETLEVKWADKNVRCMENIAVLVTS